MKKILFVIPNLSLGGAEINIINIAKILSKKNQVTVLILGFSSLKLKNYLLENKTIKIKEFNKKNFVLKLYKLIFFLKNNTFDNVISFLNTANLICLIANTILLNKFNLSISIRNILSAYFKQSIRDKLIIILIRFFLFSATKVIFNSKFSANEACKKFYFPKNKIKIIYNPVYNRFFKKKIKKNSSSKTQNYICSIGSLTKQKNFIMLLRVFNKIKNLTKLNLIIIGDGEEKTKLKNYVKSKRLNKRVKFLGRIYMPYTYINNAKFIISTSLWEGLPNVLVESALLNKFILASNCPGGNKEILKNYKNFLLFPFKDDILANLILNLEKKDLKKGNSFKIKKMFNESNARKFLI